MKTAMQELIEWFQLDTDKWDKYTQQRVKKLLKKEKEQILKAWYDSDMIITGDEGYQYYNQTYNQKVPPCSGHAFEEE